MDINLKNLKKAFLIFFRKDILNNSNAKFRCALAIALIIVDVAAASLVPYCSKEIINTLSTNSLDSIWMMIFFLGIFWILAKTINNIQEIVFFPVINNIIRDINFHLVQHIHRMSLPHYQSLSIPEVINCARRISPSARAFIKIVFLMLIPTSLKLIIATIVTIKLGVFGWLLVPTILFSIITLYKGTKWYVTARSFAWQQSDEVTTRLNDSILNTKTARYYEKFEMEQMNDLLKKEATLWQQANTRLHTIYVLIGALLGGTITMILALAAFAIQKQNLTIGDFVLLQGQLVAAFLPLKSFSTEFRQLAESLVDIKKIIKIFEIPVQKDLSRAPEQNPYHPYTLETRQSGIIFENVEFSYEKNQALFQNLNLQINPGEKVGIVGDSGCGKSSLIHLIAALHKPNAGNIYINQVNINEISKEMLTNFLHFIPQDFRLFNSSLANNLSYGIAAVTEKQLQQVIEQVGLSKLIRQMPLGINSIVGEMGIKLSGGEKQKVAIARALLRKPSILLLDETTNSLNIESEQLILETLFKHIPTVIIVCHKAISIPGLTKILKISHGKIREINIPTSDKLSIV